MAPGDQTHELALARLAHVGQDDHLAWVGGLDTELLILVPGDQNHQVAVGGLAPGDQDDGSALQANPVLDYPGRVSSGVDKGEGRSEDKAVDRG